MPGSVPLFLLLQQQNEQLLLLPKLNCGYPSSLPHEFITWSNFGQSLQGTLLLHILKCFISWVMNCQTKWAHVISMLTRWWQISWKLQFYFMSRPICLWYLLLLIGVAFVSILFTHHISCCSRHLIIC